MVPEHRAQAGLLGVRAQGTSWKSFARIGGPNKNHLPESTWLGSRIGLLSQELLKVEFWHMPVSCKHQPTGRKLGNGEKMKWAHRSSGGLLLPTQDCHRDMEGHKQGDGQAAWPMVKDPGWGLLTLLN